MTDPTHADVPDQGLFARAIGVITSHRVRPSRAVVAIPPGRRILLLVCLVSPGDRRPQFTERGRQAALDMQVQQIERFTRPAGHPESISRMERLRRYIGYITTLGVFIVLPISCLLVAAISSRSSTRSSAAPPPSSRCWPS